MAFTSKTVVRFADIDWARVVYFARFFDYAHRAFEDFFNVESGIPYLVLLEKHQLGFPIVHSEANFKAPLRLGDTARVVMEILKLSHRSVTTQFTLFRGDTSEVCAVIVLKQACIDTKTFVACSMSDEVHAALKTHLISVQTG
jgi:YbgC/YbaW family acyl-CoA thioester hydrolase